MMKHFIAILVIIMIPYSAFSQNKRIEYQNSDGSCNAYFIDTLYFDKPLFLRSKINNQFFLISTQNQYLSKKIKNNVWEWPNGYILNIYMDFWLKMPLDVIPRQIYDREKVEYTKEVAADDKSSKYDIVHFEHQPKYYVLSLIRGDAYNFLSVYNVWDGHLKPIKFKNENEYYKLLLNLESNDNL